jgi:3-methyl-2-oxobutanoate hydroxymethyltransferase
MTGFTVTDFGRAKAENKKITMITAYDFSTAKLAEEAGIDVILVGDSLGMVVLGYEDTTEVTMDDMLHHTRAVRRGAKNTFIIGDMPFLSYGADIATGVYNAGSFIKEGRCNAIKLEGGISMVDTIKSVIGIGIPVIGHLGYTPQSLNLFGRNMVRGKNYDTAKRLVEDSLELERAGVSAIVLELVPSELAAVISGALCVPTIGIGSGAGCDGQVLVINDMLGMYGSFAPKHSKIYADIGAQIRDSIARYVNEVRTKAFPSDENAFGMERNVIEKIRNEYGKSN